MFFDHLSDGGRAAHNDALEPCLAIVTSAKTASQTPNGCDKLHGPE
jgi:hypothetical protein